MHKSPMDEWWEETRLRSKRSAGKMSDGQIEMKERTWTKPGLGGAVAREGKTCRGEWRWWCDGMGNLSKGGFLAVRSGVQARQSKASWRFVASSCECCLHGDVDMAPSLGMMPLAAKPVRRPFPKNPVFHEETRKRHAGKPKDQVTMVINAAAGSRAPRPEGELPRAKNHIPSWTRTIVPAVCAVCAAARAGTSRASPKAC
jgi:hypothetical protein